MTSKTKAEIKAFFETGDKPSEAQFIDLIDSYIDKSGPLGAIETAASGGSQGFAFTSAMQGEIKGAAAARSFMGISVYNESLVLSTVSPFFTTTAQASGIANDGIINAIATTAQATAGTSSSVLMTPITTKKSIQDNIIFAQSFTSSEISISAGGTSTQSHSLSGIPKIIFVVLRCKTSELGYSVGDEVLYTNAGDDFATNSGVAVTFDATNMVSIIGSSGQIALLNKTTGTLATITNNSWRIVVRAYY